MSTGRLGTSLRRVATLLLFMLVGAGVPTFGAADTGNASARNGSAASSMIARTSQESAAPADSGVEAAVDPWRRHHLHVFIAFGLTWILILGYVLSVGRRFAQLEEEIGRLG